MDDLATRLRERAYAVAAKAFIMDDDTARNAKLFVEAADAIESLRASLTRVEEERDDLGEALHQAHAVAADRAVALDREADETSSAIKKMQGATAAVIANDILAIANGLSRPSPTSAEGE